MSLRLRKIHTQRLIVKLLDKVMRALNSFSRFLGGPLISFKVIEQLEQEALVFARTVNRSISDTGIVIQGPVNNMGIQIGKTVELYREMWPGALVIVSTWKSSDPGIVKNLKMLGAEVVLSDEPDIPGPSNANYQVTSTLAGIKKLQDLGVSNCLKTRVDQVLYNSRSLNLLRNLSNDYEDRLITTDFNSFLFRLFSANDQLMFGKTSLLEEFWVASKDLEWQSDANSPIEAKLLQKFLRARGIIKSHNIVESLETYRDFYYFVDFEDLDLFWHKGTYRDLRARFPQVVYPSNYSFIRSYDWRMLNKDLGPYVQDFERLKELGQIL